MQSLKIILDAIGNVCWLVIMWQMVKAARILASPEPDGINLILRSLNRLHIDLNQICRQLENRGV